jgi:hypothetical protein
MERSGHTPARRNGCMLGRCITLLFLLSLAGLGIAQEVEGNGKAPVRFSLLPIT